MSPESCSKSPVQLANRTMYIPLRQMATISTKGMFSFSSFTSSWPLSPMASCQKFQLDPPFSTGKIWSRVIYCTTIKLPVNINLHPLIPMLFIYTLGHPFASDFRQRKTVFDAIVVGRWSVFSFHFYVYLHLCAWSYSQLEWYHVRVVFGIEKYFGGILCLDMSPQNSGYGYDMSIYRILWYRMIWEMISRYMTPDHPETGK